MFLPPLAFTSSFLAIVLVQIDLISDFIHSPTCFREINWTTFSRFPFVKTCFFILMPSFLFSYANCDTPFIKILCRIHEDWPFTRKDSILLIFFTVFSQVFQSLAIFTLLNANFPLFCLIVSRAVEKYWDVLV